MSGVAMRMHLKERARVTPSVFMHIACVSLIRITVSAVAERISRAQHYYAHCNVKRS